MTPSKTSYKFDQSNSLRRSLISVQFIFYKIHYLMAMFIKFTVNSQNNSQSVSEQRDIISFSSKKKKIRQNCGEPFSCLHFSISVGASLSSLHCHTLLTSSYYC